MYRLGLYTQIKIEELYRVLYTINICKKRMTSNQRFGNMSYYGYFSEKQHEIGFDIKLMKRNSVGKYEYISDNGYNVWLTDDGREVITSEVTRVRDDAHMKSLWPDTQYVGHVVKWLRFVRCDSPLTSSKHVQIIERIDCKKNENKNLSLNDININSIPVGSGVNAVRKRKS